MTSWQLWSRPIFSAVTNDRLAWILTFMAHYEICKHAPYEQKQNYYYWPTESLNTPGTSAFTVVYAITWPEVSQLSHDHVASLQTSWPRLLSTRRLECVLTTETPRRHLLPRTTRLILQLPWSSIRFPASTYYTYHLPTGRCLMLKGVRQYGAFIVLPVS